MHPSERIKYIKGITEELSQEEWGLLDLTLREFGLPWTDTWSGGKEDYVIDMLSGAEDAPLLELAKHLGVASQLEKSEEPKFWSENEARVFLSHLASDKAVIAEIREALAEYGITAFVAHEDIEPTQDWQNEIESALASMDGLVAFLSPGFRESNWCDQEVGVGIGRQIPIVSVRLGLDPYGFIGKYQALQGHSKTTEMIAQEIFTVMYETPNVGPKITGALVQKLADASSFAESKSLIGLIEGIEIPHVQAR